MNETMITIIGNVITDVTPRKTADGTRVVNFRVASNQRRYDKEAQSWVDGDTLYVSVTCWRDLAKGVVSTLVKGDPVIVVGRLYTRGYEVAGQKRSITELDARAVGPDLARSRAELERIRRDGSGDPAKPADGRARAAESGVEAGGPAGERATSDPDRAPEQDDRGPIGGVRADGGEPDAEPDTAGGSTEQAGLKVVGATAP